MVTKSLRCALPRGRVARFSYRVVFCAHLLSLLKTIVYRLELGYTVYTLAISDEVLLVSYKAGFMPYRPALMVGSF